MITKVQKWGNSLALRIPKSFVKEAGLHPDALSDGAPDDVFQAEDQLIDVDHRGAERLAWPRFPVTPHSPSAWCR